MSRNTIRCIDCRGHGEFLTEYGYLTDCGTCIGKGFVSMPRELLRPDVVVPAVLLAAIVALAIVASAVWL